MDKKINGDVGGKVKPAPKPRFASSLVPYHDDSVLTDDEDEEQDEDEEESLEKESNNSEEPEQTDDVAAALDHYHLEDEAMLGDSDDEPQLPPEPQGRCSKELQDKINRLFMEMRGLDMNAVIQRRKEFRNPSIYEKLIQFCSINEFGTNYPADVYDPTVWGKESFYDELNKAQRVDMEAKEKERKEKTKVQVLVGTAKKRGAGSEEDAAPKRKSKWDQVGLCLPSIQPVTLMTAPLPSQLSDPTNYPNPRP